MSAQTVVVGTTLLDCCFAGELECWVFEGLPQENCEFLFVALERCVVLNNSEHRLEPFSDLFAGGNIVAGLFLDFAKNFVDPVAKSFAECSTIIFEAWNIAYELENNWHFVWDEC